MAVLERDLIVFQIPRDQQCSTNLIKYRTVLMEQDMLYVLQLLDIALSNSGNQLSVSPWAFLETRRYPTLSCSSFIP